jgi:hypothetical protein
LDKALGAMKDFFNWAAKQDWLRRCSSAAAIVAGEAEPSHNHLKAMFDDDGT